MARSQPWPFDDEDRPSGSVRPLSQADLQAILAHLNDDDPDQLLTGTTADRPVAVRVRASVGRPGGSAHATWRRARAAEWAGWTRSLPWRVAATLGAAAAGAVLGSLLAAQTPSRGGGERRGSGTRPDFSGRWSDTAGRSCTTWPSPGAGPTSTTW